MNKNIDMNSLIEFYTEQLVKLNISKSRAHRMVKTQRTRPRIT